MRRLGVCFVDEGRDGMRLDCRCGFLEALCDPMSEIDNQYYE